MPEEQTLFARDQSDELQLLEAFIKSNPDPRELKRALAVKMLIEGIRPAQIADFLQVSVCFVSKWKTEFALSGIEGLRLKYQGRESFLTVEQRAEVIEWLQSRDYWLLEEVEAHIEEKYNIVFKSKKSYYDLLHEAGMSWKKNQKKNPQKDEEKVKERREEIHKTLEDNKEDIRAGKLVVYMIDESHLLSGDVIGYGWGKTRERIEVPIKNEKERQTFYGALNLYTGEFHIQKYDKGETSNSIAFLEYLQSLNPDARILIFWDGASYHRSTELKKFLSDINKGKKKHEWKITCEFFAPHDPSQNPVEDIWLQAKNALRKYWQVCRNFAISKYLFEFFIHKQIFSFPKLEEYRSVFT